jgi:hypothetical protein
MACTCPCERCFQARQRLQRHAAALALAARLEKSGIDIGVLSSLIWSRLEDYLEPIVARIAEEKVGQLLDDVVLVSRVRDRHKRRPA